MYHFRNLSIKLEIISINHFQKYLLTEKCNELSDWNSFHSWFATVTCQKTLPSTQEHRAVHPSATPGKSKGETYNLQISVKLTKDVFLVPTLTTCGGFMTNFRFSPATMSGFFSRMMLKTLLSNCKRRDSHSHEHFRFSKYLTSKNLKQHSHWVSDYLCLRAFPHLLQYTLKMFW